MCGDILDLLFITDEDSKFNDISEIMTTGLHTAINLVKVIDREERYVVVSVQLINTDSNQTKIINFFINKMIVKRFLFHIRCAGLRRVPDDIDIIPND